MIMKYSKNYMKGAEDRMPKASMKPKKKKASLCEKCVHDCTVSYQARENHMKVRKCRDFLPESKVYPTRKTKH